MKSFSRRQIHSKKYFNYFLDNFLKICYSYLRNKEKIVLKFLPMYAVNVSRSIKKGGSMMLQDREVKWVKYVCDECDDDGKVTISKGNFLEYLDQEYRGKFIKKFQDGKIYRWALDEYRAWKKSGKIDCPDCGGAKIWHEPR